MNRHDPEQGRLLIAKARAAIAGQWNVDASPPIPAETAHPAWLDEPGAVFVTLTKQGELRGCIGSLEARRSLGEDLENNARAAAFGDPRFPPLAPEEWPATRVEVSILSRPEPMRFIDQADALAQLRPGIDGVVLEHGWHRATFLPQVWDQLPDPRQFMAHLKRKAGLSPDFWADDIRLSRYTVEKFKEPGS
jgi:AmmeMemoRadiSam system protein A